MKCENFEKCETEKAKLKILLTHAIHILEHDVLSVNHKTDKEIKELIEDSEKVLKGV